MARGIYKIINITNNKFYVGSAVDLKRRKTRHFSELRNRKHNNKHLQAAWDKYGEKSFIFVVVEELEADADVLAVENVWLKEHVGKEYCYNIGVDATAPSLGMSGELSPTFGRKRTAEELAAQSWQGRKHKEESKQKIRAYLIGKPKPAEVRAKISATLKGEGNFWYGKKRPDHGAKVSKTVFAMPDGILFKSLQQALDYYEIKMPTLMRALKSGNPIKRGKLVGYTFKYGGIASQTATDIALINKKLLANHEE
jgi:group I intron endonuclease